MGFIDSYAKQRRIAGYPVILPEKINAGYKICITPKNYEEEIIGQLKDMGVAEDRYFTYFDMFEKIAELGEGE